MLSPPRSFQVEACLCGLPSGLGKLDDRSEPVRPPGLAGILDNLRRFQRLLCDLQATPRGT